MLTDEQKQMVLATACIAVLVFVAFFASYSGRSLRPTYQADGAKPDHVLNNSVKTEREATGNNDVSQGAGSSKEHILPLSSNGKGPENGKNAEQRGTEFWPPFFGYRLKVTDTLIAAFTALLFAATFFLWFTTRNLVRGADDTSKRQLRAYLGVERIELKCAGFSTPIISQRKELQVIFIEILFW